MSKTCRLISCFLATLLAAFPVFGSSVEQDIEVTIRIDRVQANIARVSGRFRRPIESRNLFFLNEYAGISGLAKRVSAISLTDSDNVPVALRLQADGAFLAEKNFVSWSYTIDLSPLPDRAAVAHVSWVSSERGILFLDDILPQMSRRTSARIDLDLPDPWKSYTTEWDLGARDDYEVESIEDAVFFVGSDWRVTEIFEKRRGPIALVLLFPKSWNSASYDAGGMASEVFWGYKKVLGPPKGQKQIGFLPLSNVYRPGEFEAGTRGATVTILSTDMPFKSQSVQRLHEQLRHEMFHLWIPEGVNLTGNYDWFYEGFALYQSLKLGVAVNRLRFEDFLDSLNQAYAIDRRLGGEMSLIDASKIRWSGDNNSVIYARGMLVAFLSDLAMLEASKGKRSTDDIVREVYQKHSGTAAKQDGNAAVIAIMKQRPELVPIVERYVTGSEKLDWTPFLAAAGLEATAPNKTALTTVPKPNSRQKKLLDKLGYNNWRKLSSTRK